MNSSARSRAEETIAIIEGLLSDRVIAELINAPVEQAVVSFRFHWDPPFTHRDFLDVIGEFVMHVRECSSVKGSPSARAARDEAVSLLIRYYSGVHESGYDGAVLDAEASCPPTCEGIDVVLIRLAEHMKAEQRQEYTNWVYARYLDPFDRELLCDIVSVVQERFREVLPGDMLALAPCELADDIPHLLDEIRDFRAVASQFQRRVSDDAEGVAHRENTLESDAPSRKTPPARSFVVR